MSNAAPVQAMSVGSPLPVGMPGASITPKYQVRVRFCRRMKVQRVYRMVVELKPEKGTATGAGTGESVIARPLVPGAYVQPAEQELGPKGFNSKITFSIAPLAQGGLKKARLQILHQGRILEEIRTPMRGTSQRKTLLFALLTLLSLAYLLNIVGPLPDLSRVSVADTSKAANNPPAETTGSEPASAAKTTKVKRSVEGILLDEEKLPDYLKRDEVAEDLRPYLSQEAIAEHAQDVYNSVYTIPNLNFYLTLAFLLLTLYYLLHNRPVLWRSRRKGKPMLLPVGR
jgi:hypothetical protein